MATQMNPQENKMASEIGYDGGLTCSFGVSDIDRSIEWYQDVLGFELLYKIDDMVWCELRSAVARVNVGLSQVEELEVKGGCTLTFGVKNIAKARATLEKRGIQFDGDTITIPDMVSLATFYDPDGNKLMFYQELQTN